MDIYFSTLDRSEVYKLPVLPVDMPDLSKSAKNEEFETYDDGNYNLIGNVGLVSFSIERFLPALKNNYPFVKSKFNPYLLINLWSKAMEVKKPVRIIMYRNDKSEILNWLVTVESMSWHEDKVGDVKYRIDLKEYREID